MYCVIDNVTRGMKKCIFSLPIMHNFCSKVFHQSPLRRNSVIASHKQNTSLCLNFLCASVFEQDNAVQVCSALSASEIRDLQSPHFCFPLKTSMLRLHDRPSVLFFPAADCCETTALVPRIAIAITKAAYQNLDTDKSVFPKAPATASGSYQERAVPPCQCFFLTYSYKVQNAPVIHL